MSFIAERIFKRAALAACVGAAMTFGPSAQADDAAHAIANKFAEDTASNEAQEKQRELLRTMAELKKKADEARARADAQRQAEENESQRLYEQELLERAREESQATRRAEAEAAAQAKARAEVQAKAKAEEAARIAREKAAREQKRTAEAEAARHAKEVAQAKARAEAQARTKEAEDAARVAREKAAREAKVAAQADADRRIQEAARWAAEATAQEAEAELAARDPKNANHDRDREAHELAERLREARDKYSALGGPTVQSVPAKVKPVTATPAAIRMASPAKLTAPAEQHVTILLIMDVGKTGWRRISKTADPMLCLHEHCFLSRGSDLPAEKLSRRAAFGPTVALVKRGVSCRSSPSCIFRDIDLETAEAILQPVDLRVLRHDRRETQLIRADKTCDLIRGELVCGHTVGTTDWRAWIVPESIAQRAGPAALEMALESGLEALN